MGRPKNTVKAEYITIAELSKIVSKSPQAIYKKMRQNPGFNSYIRVFNGVKYCHKSAIWQVFGVAYEGNNPGEENPRPEEDKGTDHITALLMEQIRVKDKQIADLTEALRAEQLFRATAEQRIALLEDKLKADQTTGQEQERQGAAVNPDPDGEQAQQEPEQNPDEVIDIFGTDEEPEPEKPLSFLDRIKKALGF